MQAIISQVILYKYVLPWRLTLDKYHRKSRLLYTEALCRGLCTISILIVSWFGGCLCHRLPKRRRTGGTNK